MRDGRVHIKIFILFGGGGCIFEWNWGFLSYNLNESYFSYEGSTLTFVQLSMSR